MAAMRPSRTPRSATRGPPAVISLPPPNRRSKLSVMSASALLLQVCTLRPLPSREAAKPKRRLAAGRDRLKAVGLERSCHPAHPPCDPPSPPEGEATMSSSTLPEASRIFPTLRYRESLKMLDWLIEAFGLRVHRKYLKGRR